MSCIRLPGWRIASPVTLDRLEGRARPSSY
jgi:hypothetical protein